jgi:3-dehydroquinate synthase
VMDPEVLKTLPERALKAGLAEVVKYSLIEETCVGSHGFFEFLLSQADGLEQSFPEIIERCCRIKAAVVIQDETEQTGVRSYLNLGHTFAHAYEEITQYQTFLHGEAVAIGMAKACLLAEQLGLFPRVERERFEVLFRRLGLPLEAGQVLEPLQLLTLMRKDKKAAAGKIKMVLPTDGIGRVSLRDDISDEAILSVL